MGALVLVCGVSASHSGVSALTERDDVSVVAVPARPGRDAVDPVLADLGDRRLVVAGTDADLAAVVVRLMRKERLADVAVGYVPAVTENSEVAALWGLPADVGRSVDVALGTEVDPIPLVRDDAGGVLVGLGTIGPVRGVAYCDDATAMRGRADRIDVTPDPAGGLGLIVHVTRRGLLGKRTETLRGRAFQLGSLPIQPVLDGERHPRQLTKWTWYRHTEDLRVARGLV